MIYWCGSGSADPCIWLIDPDSDPDPAIFVIYLQDANQKLFLLNDGTRRIRNRIHTSDYWIRIRIQEAQKHEDPVDPDPDSDPYPQHCLKMEFVGDLDSELLTHHYLPSVFFLFRQLVGAFFLSIFLPFKVQVPVWNLRYTVRVFMAYIRVSGSEMFIPDPG